ncbi:sulfite exporter TauE/SafE family protein [Pedobacter ginsengisoli]|uniref:sulfite exporter TauE/SafE family protein n=1 Tax=Pedobacter ginsengisoli TaxID=363852 RepID=UPI00254D5143|nr:sulfite exporter TauE/SafE family protein [Pedobacter ginsengisoli]
MMHLFPTVLIVSLIVMIAALFRSAFGFGESLIAVPLLSMVMPLNAAVPLSVLVSVFVAAFVVAQDRKKVYLKSAAYLILYALIGVPLGLWLLVHAQEMVVKLILGALMISFSVYLLKGSELKALKEDSQWWLLVCGMLSGVFGGAYGINGPPLVIYGAKRRWTAVNFRATLQAYFFIVGLISIAGYWQAGLLDAGVLKYFLWSLPALVPAILAGRFINSRMQNGRFFKYSYLAVLALGTLVILNCIYQV